MLSVKIKTVCSTCGKVVERWPCEVKLSKSGLFFCSKGCSNKYFAKPHETNPCWKGGLIEKRCLNCGVLFLVYPYRAETAKFCSNKCWHVYHKGRHNRGWIEREALPQYTSFGNWLEMREKVLERDEHKCHKCGSTEKLVVHHLLPFRVVMDHKIENLITLCKTCHMRLHSINRKRIK